MIAWIEHHPHGHDRTGVVDRIISSTTIYLQLQESVIVNKIIFLLDKILFKLIGKPNCRNLPKFCFGKLCIFSLLVLYAAPLPDLYFRSKSCVLYSKFYGTLETLPLLEYEASCKWISLLSCSSEKSLCRLNVASLIIEWSLLSMMPKYTTTKTTSDVSEYLATVALTYDYHILGTKCLYTGWLCTGLKNDNNLSVNWNGKVYTFSSWLGCWVASFINHKLSSWSLGRHCWDTFWMSCGLVSRSWSWRHYFKHQLKTVSFTLYFSYSTVKMSYLLTCDE